MATSIGLESPREPGADSVQVQKFESVLSAALTRMALAAGQTVDELLVRQWIREARASFPGDVESQWWHWLRIAAASTGLNVRVVELPRQQVFGLVDNGIGLVTVVKQKGELAAVQLVNKKKKLTASYSTITGNKLLDEAAVDGLLREAEQDGKNRWLVSNAVDYRTNLLPKGKPWKRLLAVFSAEASDIWIVILFAFLVGLLSLATPIAVESLVNTVSFGRLLQPVIVLSLLLFGFLTFRGAMQGLQTYAVEIIQRRMFARMTSALSYRLPRVDHEALDSTDGPELVNRFLDIVTVQKVMANLLLDGVAIVMGTLIGMAVLAFYHPLLMVFSIMLLFMVISGIILLGRGVVRSAVEESKYKYHVVSWFEDIIHSQLALKLGGASDFASERSNHWTNAYLGARQKHFRILLRQILFVLFLQAIAATVLLGLGGWLVIQGQLSLGQLVAAEIIVSAILSSLTKLGKHLEGFYDALAAVDKLGYLFDLPLESNSGLIQTWAPGAMPVDVSDMNYEMREKRVFSAPVNFKFRPGGITAITGVSGSGKSILLDLLYGLRKPSAGHIDLAGFEPREVRPETLREKVALVRSDNFLTGSVAENVHLHRPEVGTSQVREALSDVGMVEEMRLLPEGYNTHITQQGVPLTTSQQQQILLARALAGEPSLLLIDGSLDLLPAEKVVQIMGMLKDKDMTVLVATNRPDVITLCEDRLKLQPALSF
ncbi:peptidase domain-containing ABC transporter [Bythopirellula goksoeyrii]|uniref:Toxin RTX-I translocation ATP-binding protein n=1 Tax=Bythopirellula goksoeyrii TaxID=1400387 RepID=A0A5B9QDV4_9BACT|nr:ABC transporter ATP-binding protein [Bythopirellula goksoeyrii]QEG37084.1 Toxin RTX-I translocation ATP-binding protein [Bythopirellula goksoeyrii]